MIALVAMLGFTACEKDCDHNFIEYDHNKDLVGTWTYLADNGQAEAMVINEDGSFAITGIMKSGDIYEERGTIKAVNNQVTLSYEDGSVFEGRLELVAGKSMSIVFNKEYEVCLTYDYCQNDLSDEILGMWVCNETPTPVENDMLIINYKADGTTLFSGYFYEAREFWVNTEGYYKVIGDLLFHKQPDNALQMGVAQYSAMKLTYSPNANAYGDLMYLLANARVGENFVQSTTSWLRVKQHLDLPGMQYNYNKTFVSNVKGLDKEIKFMGYVFNFANIDGSGLDKVLKALLFNVEFPNANTIKYNCRYKDQNMSMEAPIVVDGNKMTVKMSAKNAAYKDVDIYTFQDQDNTQMHMYMHSTGFVNFFGNMQVAIMEQLGQLDTTDAAAVQAIFKSIDDAVETINVSFIMTKSTKAL